jgi:cytochrome c5
VKYMMSRHMVRGCQIAALGGLLGAGLMTIAPALSAQQQAAPAAAAQMPKAGAPTFAKDIAPIFQKKCQVCHQPGSIAPMALLTYADTRPWVRSIKDKVSNHSMPPWPIDKTIGIQEFSNDMSLADRDVESIVRWVDAGAPQGNPADMPPPVKWPDYVNSWRYEQRFGRPPDLIVESPAYTVVANGMDQFPPMSTKVTGLKSERWIRAIEIKPANPESRYVFHHANPSLKQDGKSSPLIASAVGTEGQIFPDDAGKVIKPDSTVSFGMHFWPIAKDVKAVMVLGLWFYPEGEKPPYETQGQVQFRADMSTGATSPAWNKHSREVARRGDLLIPPNGTAMYQGTYVLDRPARIHDIRGHMHVRGKYQIVEAVYPDGHREVINKLNWDHAWHTTFVYEPHARPLLPKGTVLITTSMFDNTPHKGNPDPDQWVVAGSRTVDEMSHIWIGMTFFDKEEDFKKVVAEQQRLRKPEIKTTAAPAGRD